MGELIFDEERKHAHRENARVGGKNAIFLDAIIQQGSVVESYPTDRLPDAFILSR